MAVKLKRKERDIEASDRRVMSSWNDSEFEELRVFLGISLSREELLGRSLKPSDHRSKSHSPSRKASNKATAS